MVLTIENWNLCRRQRVIRSPIVFNCDAKSENVFFV